MKKEDEKYKLKKRIAHNEHFLVIETCKIQIKKSALNLTEKLLEINKNYLKTLEK